MVTRTYKLFCFVSELTSEQIVMWIEQTLCICWKLSSVSMSTSSLGTNKAADILFWVFDNVAFASENINVVLWLSNRISFAYTFCK